MNRKRLGWWILLGLAAALLLIRGFSWSGLVPAPPDSKTGSPQEFPPDRVLSSNRPGPPPESRRLRRRSQSPPDSDLEETIEDALAEPDLDEQAHAVSRLGLWDYSPRLLNVIRQVLVSPRSEVRVEAVRVLADWEQPVALPLLEQVMVGDPSEEVREAASQAMAAIEAVVRERSPPGRAEVPRP